MSEPSSVLALASAVRRGDRRRLARAITAVESRLDGWTTLVDLLYPHVGRAWRLGITGPPGAGKSTLADRLIARFRTEGKTVAVVAVDPTSPFTGGALLGDRVRMQGWHADDGVFIRSLATRGALGGLSLAADSVADVLDAAGYDVVLLETVGVGQAEIDVAQACDTVLVVLSPEGGDAVQAMKAGLMEIADVFCVNKAEHPDAARFARTVRDALALREGGDMAEVLETVATSPEGLAGVAEALESHRIRLEESGAWERRRTERLRSKVRRIVEARYLEVFWTPSRRAFVAQAVEHIETSERRPFQLAERVLDEHPNTRS